MPGAGHSESLAVRFIGAMIGLIAAAGSLVLAWLFSNSKTTILTAIGIIVAVSAVGWILYSHMYSDEDLV